MNRLILLCLLVLTDCVYGQSKKNQEKYRHLEPDIWMSIWDEENSSKSIKIDTLSYDEIPKYLDFKGTVVEALHWTDSSGENILIQSVTGHFTWKEYDSDSTSFVLQDKSELYAYLFVKSNAQKSYQRLWKVYDYIECFGVDWYLGYIPKSTTITDLDKDGIAEISMPYVAICRGGMDPGSMKIILYEDSIKYALRGTTMLMCEGDHPYGGEFEPNDNLKNKSVFMEFLESHWHRNKCENGRF